MTAIPYWQQRAIMKNGPKGVVARKAKSLPTPQKAGGKKKRTWIKPASKKTAKRNRKLAKAYGPFLEAHPDCEVQMPGCTGVAKCVHHTGGRGVNEVHDQSTWKASCPHCNTAVEIHHKEAEARGLKNRRTHKKIIPK